MRCGWCMEEFEVMSLAEVGEVGTDKGGYGLN